MNSGADGTDGSNTIDSDGCHDRAQKRVRLLATTNLSAAGNRALENERCQQLQSGARRTGKRRRTDSNDATSEGQPVREPHHATQVQFTAYREQTHTHIVPAAAAARSG
jgi:hypothetical protein